MPVIMIGVAHAALTTLIALEGSHSSVFAGLAIIGGICSAFRLILVYVFRRRFRSRHFRAWEAAYAVGSYTFSVVLAVTVSCALVWGDDVARILGMSLFFAYGGGLVARASLVPWISKGALTVVALIVTVTMLLAWEPFFLGLLLLTIMMYGGGLATIDILHSTVSELELSQRQLEIHALTDHLTGLPNRKMLEDSLAGILNDLKPNEVVALHFIDLDQFKTANDTYGHTVGDRALQIAARRLISTVHNSDFVARFGGDEFVIVQRGLRSKDHAEELGWQIIAKLSQPYAIDNHSVVIGASDGIALANVQGLDPATLIELSDKALYSAKRAGRGRVVVTEDGLQEFA
ncbi:GGDEF domain-containing protein [Amorphus orientalis]|uniref:Diguanylate cyclase (GGDEF)-like protein n=1 Tax=Amorphus orientalis TaxID=649198 RepID=A0AAE4AV35_9HYPH|nr:GGDEF domain-containing protein [Amorphus orientalis]MDQ0316319.1 diguanylate cyclase (GGDEF)-like protein [Amorphus orientalis]